MLLLFFIIYHFSNYYSIHYFVLQLSLAVWLITSFPSSLFSLFTLLLSFPLKHDIITFCAAARAFYSFLNSSMEIPSNPDYPFSAWFLLASADLLGLSYLFLFDIFEIDYFLSLFLFWAVEFLFLMYSALLLDLALFTQTVLLWLRIALIPPLDICTGLYVS